VAPRKTTSTHVTLLDVARASGFSASTVSIVLNDAPLSRHVAAKTKEHIRKTALEMGYHPDAFARSLRRRRSHTIGVLVFDISDPFCMSLLRGIEETLYATPYLPIIMDANNRREQFERYLDMLLERRVEGVVVVANWLFSEIDPLSEIEKNHIPAVVVGRDLAARNMRSVFVDNEAGGYAAMEHLYRLGHRQIAVLRGPEELDDSSRRWQGIQRFASEVALEIDPRLTARFPAALDPNSGFDGGLRLTTALIDSGNLFSAILAFDDLTALGAIRALWQAGRRVPEDCSVIGFDDVPQAELNSPGITTIRQPMQEMGSLATRLVLEAISAPEAAASSKQLVYPMEPILVRRDSTQVYPAEIR
jgi:DNA-binding LacI/PurR family transcriptional regulator